MLEFINNLNKIGKIKTVIIVFFVILSFVNTSRASVNKDNFFILFIPFVTTIFPILISVYFSKLFFSNSINRPNWNDNPLTFKRPLSFFDFWSIWFISVGLSDIISKLIIFQEISFLGLIQFCYGLSIYINIELILKWANKNKK